VRAAIMALIQAGQDDLTGCGGVHYRLSPNHVPTQLESLNEAFIRIADAQHGGECPSCQ
jgi:hypothetical protein